MPADTSNHNSAASVLALTESAEADLAELRSIRAGSTTRPWVTSALDKLVNEAERRVADAKKNLSMQTAAAAAATEAVGVKLASAPAPPPVPVGDVVPITQFAFDQSDKFVSVYITMNGVGALPTEQITWNFTETTAEVVVAGYNGKTHRFKAEPLCEEVTPGSCKVLIKADRLVVKLAKKVSGEWSHVDHREKKKEAERKERIKGKDTMGMLQDMFENGDEKTKESLAKAWEQGRSKREARNFGH